MTSMQRGAFQRTKRRQEDRHLKKRLVDEKNPKGRLQRQRARLKVVEKSVAKVEEVEGASFTNQHYEMCSLFV